MTLVDDGRGGLELVPDGLADVLGDGSGLAPLLVEVLELAEGCHGVWLSLESLCLVDEGALVLKVLAEVEVAQLLVHLESVIELLYGELVVLPGVGDVAGGYVGNGLEVSLELLELGEVEVYIVDVVGQLAELVDDFLFENEVFALAFLLGAEVLAAELTEGVEEFLKLRLGLVDGGGEGLGGIAGLYVLIHLGLDLAVAEGVERLLDGGHFLMCGGILGADNLAEGVYKLGLGQGVVVDAHLFLGFLHFILAGVGLFCCHAFQGVGGLGDRLCGRLGLGADLCGCIFGLGGLGGGGCLFLSLDGVGCLGHGLGGRFGLGTFLLGLLGYFGDGGLVDALAGGGFGKLRSDPGQLFLVLVHY